MDVIYNSGFVARTKLYHTRIIWAVLISINMIMLVVSIKSTMRINKMEKRIDLLNAIIIDNYSRIGEDMNYPDADDQRINPTPPIPSSENGKDGRNMKLPLRLAHSVTDATTKRKIFYVDDKKKQWHAAVEQTDTTTIKNNELPRSHPENIEQELEVVSKHSSYDIGEFAWDRQHRIRNDRRRRHIVAETTDGVKINSESYMDHKSSNHSLPINLTADNGMNRASPNFLHPNIYAGMKFPERATVQNTSPVYARTSRVMHSEDKSKAFKQVVKKSMLKSSARNFEEQDDGMTVVRDNRRSQNAKLRRVQQHVETLDEPQVTVGRGKRRQTTAIHFNGDTSSYVFGVHTNYKGEGHLKHAQKTYVDWTPNSWGQTINIHPHFKMDKGFLTFKEAGVYFIYAQIYYLDPHDMNGYRIYRNNDTIMQCTSTASSNENLKGSTCYTAGLEYFNEGDTLCIKDLSEDRWSIFLPGYSFFGVIKFVDGKTK